MRNRSFRPVSFSSARAGLARCAVAAGALLLAAAAADAAQCSLFDAGTDESADGPCTVEYDAHTEVMTIGGRRVVFVLAERQGQWAVGTLDGKPAMRYEANRVTYSYATQDLTLFLDRND